MVSPLPLARSWLLGCPLQQARRELHALLMIVMAPFKGNAVGLLGDSEIVTLCVWGPRPCTQGIQDLERQQINDWLSEWLVESEARWGGDSEV